MDSSRRALIKALACSPVLFITGCADDFLARTPLDEVTGETFWNTSGDLETYNNTFYEKVQDDDRFPIVMGHNESAYASHYGNLWILDEFSDNLAPTHPRHNRYNEVRSGKHSVPSNPQWFGYQGWDLIRAINIGLANYGNADIPKEEKNKYGGEARLFRAWFYGEKVQKFGAVSWLDKPLNTDSEELTAPRTPRETVMDNVLADINFAVEHLPETWGGNPGRLDKWDALLVKSRMCLFEGTWRQYHGGSNASMWLEEAAKASRRVIDGGPYAVYNTGDVENDYGFVHRQVDLSGMPEAMYWRKYEPGIVANEVQDYFGYTGGATKDFVESFLCTDGLPISLSSSYQGDETIEDVFKNRDPRLRQTILHPADKEKYNYHSGDSHTYPRITGMQGGRISSTGYHVIKFYNADDTGGSYGNGRSSAITLRYAEALLNYAEAKAELGQITQSDLDMSVNVLRDRVGMPHMELGNIPVDPQMADQGVSPLIAEIRRERRVELFMEGHRYSDLMRWAQGKQLEKTVYGMRWNAAAAERYPGATIKTSADPASGKEYIDVYQGTDWANPVFDEGKHYLWPIPTSVLSQNSSVKQNPGW